MAKKILFITWDGPQTSYMEGLFMPIFYRVAQMADIEFHVIQFTWASADRVSTIAAAAQQKGITYTAYPIQRRPHPIIGSILTVRKGKRFIEQYIKEHNITVVMPRSTFPAIMLNLIKSRSFKVVFDADGLPLEERVDFGSLKKSGLQYKFLKRQETLMLKQADAIITRSQKAVDIHLWTIGQSYRSKFFVVFNGRDENLFQPDEKSKVDTQEKLGFDPSDKVFVYCGSLGAQYGWDQMLAIFANYAATNSGRWLILTGDKNYAEQRVPLHLKDKITIITTGIDNVPKYLNVADVAFAIRQPSHSMKGVAPIKLGEYLLMGIPTIASTGIGDTEDILQVIPNCFAYHHTAAGNQAEEIQNWLTSLSNINKEDMRQKALTYFSLSAAAGSYINAFNNIH